MYIQSRNVKKKQSTFSLILYKFLFSIFTFLMLNSQTFADNNDALSIDTRGNVGIGTSTPRSRLDTGAGVMSGAANDYQKAQFTLSGGGKVTWGGPGGRLKWTERFIAIGMERPSSFSEGFVNIFQPKSDLAAANVYDGKVRSANEDGVVLKEWDALYAIHSVGGNKSAVSFRIVQHRYSFNAPSNWLLIAVVNGDDKTVKLGTGTIVAKNSASNKGSSLPSGMIVMWSGSTKNIPDGWVICDGKNSTPDLRDRFIVGAGKTYPVGQKGGQKTVTLTTSQMPRHNHANGEYSRLVRKNKSSDGKEAFGSGSNNTNRFNLRWHAGIKSNGGNKAHENRPPYYALAYIMKL